MFLTTGPVLALKVSLEGSRTLESIYFKLMPILRYYIFGRPIGGSQVLKIDCTYAKPILELKVSLERANLNLKICLMAPMTQDF